MKKSIFLTHKFFMWQKNYFACNIQKNSFREKNFFMKKKCFNIFFTSKKLFFTFFFEQKKSAKRTQKCQFFVIFGFFDVFLIFGQKLTKNRQKYPKKGKKMTIFEQNRKKHPSRRTLFFDFGIFGPGTGGYPVKNCRFLAKKCPFLGIFSPKLIWKDLDFGFFGQKPQKWAIFGHFLIPKNRGQKRPQKWPHFLGQFLTFFAKKWQKCMKKIFSRKNVFSWFFCCFFLLKNFLKKNFLQKKFFEKKFFLKKKFYAIKFFLTKKNYNKKIMKKFFCL